jgi:hypothetical protein
MNDRVQFKRFLFVGSMLALLMLMGCISLVRSIYAK